MGCTAACSFFRRRRIAPRRIETTFLLLFSASRQVLAKCFLEVLGRTLRLSLRLHRCQGPSRRGRLSTHPQCCMVRVLATHIVAYEKVVAWLREGACGSNGKPTIDNTSSREADAMANLYRSVACALVGPLERGRLALSVRRQAHMAARHGVPSQCGPRLSFLCGFEKRASRRAGRGRHRARRPPCEGPSRTDTDVRQAKRLSRAFLTPTDTACIHAARPMGMACTAPRSFSRRSSAVSAACSLIKP